MHRQLVSHCTRVDRPSDWAEVCLLAEVAAEIAKQRKYTDHCFSRSIPKNSYTHGQHMSRDRFEWDKEPKITLHVEGWVEKE